MKSFAALVLSLMCATQAHAIDCETDPAKFAFSEDTLTPFYFGTEAGVDRAYQVLKEKIGRSTNTASPRSFIPKATTDLRSTPAAETSAACRT